jgi:hypothetical protein
MNKDLEKNRGKKCNFVAAQNSKNAKFKELKIQGNNSRAFHAFLHAFMILHGKKLLGYVR